MSEAQTPSESAENTTGNVCDTRNTGTDNGGNQQHDNSRANENQIGSNDRNWRALRQR